MPDEDTLKKERDWYKKNYLELAERSNWEKYVGLYSRKVNTLVLHYSKNAEIFPYNAEDCDPIDTEENSVKVKGSWDNWEEEYPLLRKVLKEDGVFVGYAYCITLNKDLHDTKCVFKLIDSDANWIEPVDEEYTTEEEIKKDIKGGAVMPLIKENGIWNALVYVKYPNNINPYTGESIYKALHDRLREWYKKPI